MNISDLVGIPYKTHGRDESGLDCFGLIWVIAKRNGTPIRDPVYKGFNCALTRLADYVGLKSINEFNVGCVLEIEKEGRLHLGYAINEYEMMHCTINDGVVVEDIGEYQVNGYWKF